MIVRELIQLYILVIIARSIISFFPIRRDSPFIPVVRFLHNITEPVLAPIRRALPPMGGLDLSPLVVIIVLRVLQGFIP
jgi:YggT family protein